MELAVFADIHGNHIALRRCIADAVARTAPQKPTFLFLGDYLGDFAFPQKTMQLLYGLAGREDCVFIRGNKEEYWLNARRDGLDAWRKGSSTTGMLLYNYRALKPRDFAFFKGLPIAQTYTAPGLPPLLLCHGSPRQVKEQLLPDSDATAQAVAQANAMGIDTVLCGHTHRQERMDAPGGKVLNAGSVGQPVGLGGAACYLLLHGRGTAWQEEFVTLPYDIQPVLAEMAAAELDAWAPAWSAITRQMLQGRCAAGHGQLLVRAMQLTRQQLGNCIWPDIPESCWRQALEEAGVAL